MGDPSDGLINIKGSCGERSPHGKTLFVRSKLTKQQKTMKRPGDKLIAGIDLHSNNLVIGMINQDGKRLEHRTLACDLKAVVDYLQPFKPRLLSLAVESTFNWYWLVDGLRAQGYPIDLANPAQIQQYSGLKHADDKHDAFHLAELQRLKILPKAYVYDPALRPVRDLLRRRTNLVQQRTALLLSFKSLYARTTGQALCLNEVKRWKPEAGAQLYEHPAPSVDRAPGVGTHRGAGTKCAPSGESGAGTGTRAAAF
jgi:hypothetical protein